MNNIRIIKIIAIVLGLLIILGLFILFIGLSNSYNSLDKSKKNNPVILEKHKLNVFNFRQPIGAQLISSSLGKENEILLRYIYKGNNVLVILNSKTKQLRSIITLKKGSKFGIN